MNFLVWLLKYLMRLNSNNRLNLLLFFLYIKNNTADSVIYLLSSIFNHLILSLCKKKKLANFTEMPVGSLTYSRLVTTSCQNKIPKIAWMTGSGILMCDIDYKILTKFNNPNPNSVSLTDVMCLITEDSRKIIV